MSEESEEEEEEEEELVIDEMRRRRGRGREAGGVVTQMIPSLGALQVSSVLLSRAAQAQQLVKRLIFPGIFVVA